MPTPSEIAYKQASTWRKKARESRKEAQGAIDFLRSKKSTLSKKLLKLLAKIEKDLKDPKAPKKVANILKKYDVDIRNATRHILAKLSTKEISPKNREKLEDRWDQWTNTWLAIWDIRWRLREALKFDHAAEMQDELGDALEKLE